MPELLRRFPTLKYMIVSDGNGRRRLEKSIRSRSIQADHFYRKIPEQEKASHYCLADAYVMPNYGEGSVLFFSKLWHAGCR